MTATKAQKMPLPATNPAAAFGAGAGEVEGFEGVGGAVAGVGEVEGFEGVGGAVAGTGLGVGGTGLGEGGAGGCPVDATTTISFSPLAQLPGVPLMK